jgi:hypothetical protein
VVTHDSRIYEFGDQIAAMEDGRIVSASSSVAQGSAPEARAVQATTGVPHA